MNHGARRTAERRNAAISLENTYLGVCIGARSISMTRAHVDLPANLIRLQERTVPFPLARGHALSMGQIGQGLRECWQDFAGFEGRKCAVLLPSWCSSARTVSRRMPIRPAWGVPEGSGSPSVVTGAHVRRLTNDVCRQDVPPGKVVTGIAYERFILGGEFTVDDPVSTITTDLEVHAHLFLADHGIAKGVLDVLGSLDIQADVLATPLSALSALLPAEEKEAECILVEVSQRHTACGLFRLGRPVRLVEAEWGTDDVLTGLAGRLGVDERTVARCLASKQEWMLSPGVCGSLPLVLGAERPVCVRTVGEVDAAVAASSLPLVARIQATIEDAVRDSGFASRTVILLGDCPVLLRAIAEAGNRATPMRWRARQVPEWHRDHVDSVTMDRTRMAGVLKLCALTPPKIQPYLASYYRVPVTPEFRGAVEAVRGAGHGMAGIWRAARPHLRRACDRVVRSIPRIPAMLRLSRPSAGVPPPAG